MEAVVFGGGGMKAELVAAFGLKAGADERSDVGCDMYCPCSAPGADMD